MTVILRSSRRQIFALLIASSLGTFTAPASLRGADPATQPVIQIPGRPDIEAIVLPQFDAFEPAVRDQLRRASEAAMAAISSDQATDVSMATIVGELAKLFHAYELYETALPIYQLAVTLEPDNAEWRYLLGHVARGAGDLDRAIKAWTETYAMLGANGNDARLLTHLGRAHQAHGTLDAARQYLEHALAVDPVFSAAQASLGEIELAEGDPQGAIALLESALEAVPEANRLHYQLGMAYRKAGDLDAARQHLAARGPVGLAVPDPRLDALQALKTGERVYLLRGRQAFAAGRFKEAEAAFRTAAEADPKSSRARVNLAAALAQLNDLESAIAALREAIEIDPESGTAHFNLGQLLHPRAPDEGLEHFRRAATLDPANGTNHRVLADALRARGLREEALAAYVEATAWSPDDEDAILGRATILVELGQYAEATRGLIGVNKRLPWQGRIAVALARLLAASPDASVRDGDRALTLASQVYESTSRPEHARLVALALAELGRCDEAANLAAQIIEALPGDHPLRQPLVIEGAAYTAGPPCRPPLAAPTPAASQR